MHAVTVRQNLHQLQAGENLRNAAADKVFSRIGPQNDPLEGGKILLSTGAMIRVHTSSTVPHVVSPVQ